jgi:hypothetical protein
MRLGERAGIRTLDLLIKSPKQPVISGFKITPDERFLAEFPSLL